MLTEYRIRLTVKTPTFARQMGEWELLLSELGKSHSTRGPVMKCPPPYSMAEFTVSYPAPSSEEAGRVAIDNVREATQRVGWPPCDIAVDSAEEVDLEKELQEGRRRPRR